MPDRKASLSMSAGYHVQPSSEPQSLSGPPVAVFLPLKPLLNSHSKDVTICD